MLDSNIFVLFIWGENVSRRRKTVSSSGNDGCMVALFPLFLVVGLIGSVIQAIAENFGIVLIILVVVGAVAGIVAAINGATKKSEAAKAEKERNLAIINETEKRPALSFIPSSLAFANKEEERINLSFRDYLQFNNDIVIQKAHIDFLSKKAAAFRALGNEEGAAPLDTEIKQSQSSLSAMQSKRTKTFESKLNNLFYRSSEIRNAFTSFASKLPNERLPIVGDFFQGPQIRTVKVGDNSVLMFTPCYVLFYSGPSAIIKLVRYSDIHVSSWIRTEILDGQRQPSDEIEHIGYLYETRDGRRDMRYSYSNNPSYTYVYRGEVSISCQQASCDLKFSNKSQTEEFEKRVKAYIELIGSKYKGPIDQLIANNDKLESAISIDSYIAQQAEEERARLAQIQAEKEKEEKERLAREAKAEERRRKEQAKREAANLEKKRKEDFLKSLTIVDGTLTNWYGNESNITIPEGLVTTIGTAFRWKNQLQSIVLPEGITTIQGNAFHGSSSLKRIVLPSTVSEIGKEAFYGCSSLSDISLPIGITAITEQAFAKCSALKALTIPEGVKKIERGAFSGCNSLREITIPNGVTAIEDEAFENCSSLTKLVLPDSVNKIGKNVFNGCSSLESVFFGDGIKRIPPACFANLQKLLDVTLPLDLIEIGDRAFKNCQKLTDIHFRDLKKSSALKGLEFELLVSGVIKDESPSLGLLSLERIGKSSFENCFSFTGIKLNQGIRSIDDYAFANCRSIKEINIPAGIKSIGIGAFLGCVSLSIVNGSENVEWQKKTCFTGTPWLSTQAKDGFVVFDKFLEAYTGKDELVIIPDGVQTIGRSSFDGNGYITEVTIPAGVVEIEELAFANCRKLKIVRIADSVSKIEDNAFANDGEFIIQCSRGSAASAFRIKNKIPGEYVSKPKSDRPTKPTTRRTGAVLDDSLAGLSDEERRIIMGMRRDKLAQKKAMEEQPAVPEKTDYVLSAPNDDKVLLRIADDNRKINNNIFNVLFIQTAPVDENKSACEFESFVVDSNGQIISNIREIRADKADAPLSHKVTYTLNAQKTFDKNADYFIVLRYKGAGTDILSKTQYQINIAFVSDFDF